MKAALKSNEMSNIDLISLVPEQETKLCEVISKLNLYPIYGLHFCLITYYMYVLHVADHACYILSFSPQQPARCLACWMVVTKLLKLFAVVHGRHDIIVKSSVSGYITL